MSKERVVSAMINESIENNKDVFAQHLKKHNGNCPCCGNKWPKKSKSRKKNTFRVYGEVADLLNKQSEVSTYAAAVIEWESGYCLICGNKR